jgi:hypothetical protein
LLRDGSSGCCGDLRSYAGYEHTLQARNQIPETDRAMFVLACIIDPDRASYNRMHLAKWVISALVSLRNLISVLSNDLSRFIFVVCVKLN